MLSTILVIILVGLYLFRVITGPFLLVKSLICFLAGLVIASLITPWVLDGLTQLLGSIVPLVLLRVLNFLFWFLLGAVLCKKCLNFLAQKYSPDATNSLFSKSIELTVLSIVGVALFFFGLLGYAKLVDYKVLKPIVGTESYYQSPVNFLSQNILGNELKSDFIVAQRKVAEVGSESAKLNDDLSDYDTVVQPYKPQNQVRSDQTVQPIVKSPKPTMPKTAQQPITPEEFAQNLPDLAITKEDIDELQVALEEELGKMLKEDPELLKNSLAEALNDEKAQELSDLFDRYQQENRPTSQYLEAIESFMGDPNNLSQEFRDNLPDILREMELTVD